MSTDNSSPITPIKLRLVDVLDISGDATEILKEVRVVSPKRQLSPAVCHIQTPPARRPKITFVPLYRLMEPRATEVTVSPKPEQEDILADSGSAGDFTEEDARRKTRAKARVELMVPFISHLSLSRDLNSSSVPLSDEAFEAALVDSFQQLCARESSPTNLAEGKGLGREDASECDMMFLRRQMQVIARAKDIMDAAILEVALRPFQLPAASHSTRQSLQGFDNVFRMSVSAVYKTRLKILRNFIATEPGTLAQALREEDAAPVFQDPRG